MGRSARRGARRRLSTPTQQSQSVLTSDDSPFAQTLSIPLAVGGEVFGVLTVGFSSTRELDEEERRTASILGRQCAQAFERSRLFDDEQRARGRSERLQELTTALSSALTPDDVLDVFLRQAGPAVGATGVGVGLVRDETGEPLRASWRELGLALPDRWLELDETRFAASPGGRGGALAIPRGAGTHDCESRGSRLHGRRRSCVDRLRATTRRSSSAWRRCPCMVIDRRDHRQRQELCRDVRSPVRPGARPLPPIRDRALDRRDTAAKRSSRDAPVDGRCHRRCALPARALPRSTSEVTGSTRSRWLTGDSGSSSVTWWARASRQLRRWPSSGTGCAPSCSTRQTSRPSSPSSTACSTATPTRPSPPLRFSRSTR